MPTAKVSAYEQTDIEPWLLGSLAGGLAAFLVLTPFVLKLAYLGVQPPSPASAPPINAAAPRLQTAPPRELAALRNAEDRWLASYGWIDKSKKSVHMPIDRAMSLIQQRGLSGWQRP